MPKGHDHAERHLHVTAAANLAVNGRHTLFTPGYQAVIVGEDLFRDFGAQIRHDDGGDGNYVTAKFE